MTSSLVLGFLAETFIHPGIGQTQSAIDLPVAREETTGIPYIAGSSFKGALKELARAAWPDPDPQKDERHPNIPRLFGHEEGAGQWLVSDVRLLFLPVRTLTESYRWATCPLVLRRFLRDLKRAQHAQSSIAAVPWAPAESEAVVFDSSSGKLHVEEFAFDRQQSSLDDWGKAFAAVMPVDVVGDAAKRLVVLHDNRFAWFARHGLPVRARNALEQDTKVVADGALWYEEYLPPETVMYGLIGARSAAEQVQSFKDLHALGKASRDYIQVGGDATVGLGWFRIVRPPEG